MRRAIRTAGAWLPLVAAIPFLALALTFGLAAIWGGQVRTIVSASMEPSISRGSLIVVVPIEHPVRVGTVVVFSDPFNKSRTIAHRVIETVRSSGGELNYRTRGDANPREDARPIPDEQIIGRVRTRIPAVGTFVQSAHTIPGAALIMGLPVGALLIERSSRKRKIQRDLVPPGKTREIEVFLRTDRTYSEADILLASPVGSRP